MQTRVRKTIAQIIMDSGISLENKEMVRQLHFQSLCSYMFYLTDQQQSRTSLDFIVNISWWWINSLHPRQGQRTGLNRRKNPPLILRFFLIMDSACKELNGFTRYWHQQAKFSALIQCHYNITLLTPVKSVPRKTGLNENGSVPRRSEDAQQLKKMPYLL